MPAAGQWRMTPSLPRASLLLLREGTRSSIPLLTRAFHPSTRVPSGISAFCSSKMASTSGITVEKPGPPRQNAWIGSAGAAGRDLRSQFLFPSMF